MSIEFSFLTYSANVQFPYYQSKYFFPDFILRKLSHCTCDTGFGMPELRTGSYTSKMKNSAIQHLASKIRNQTSHIRHP